jgi:hypothetical protein
VSEFKVGDRITADGCTGGATCTGVVVEVGPHGLVGDNEYLIRPDGGGGNRYVRKDTAVAAEPEVRKGDRVRVTSVVEAVVTGVYGNGFRTEGPHYYRKPDNETRTVQILERAKPDLRPGDVVIGDRCTYLIGDRNVHYTSWAGTVIDAGETPDGLAERIASDPDRYTHIKHSDLKGFKA